MTQVRLSYNSVSRALQRGFTLVELVAVMIVMGILGAVGVSNFFDRNTFDSRAFGDETAALMRYAQKLAIAQNRDVFVQLSANRVALCYNVTCATAERVRAPGGANNGSATTTAACNDAAWACAAPPPGITIATVTAFYFDPLGKPFKATDVSPTPDSTFTTLAVGVAGGAQLRTITVEAETGYVH